MIVARLTGLVILVIGGVLQAPLVIAAGGALFGIGRILDARNVILAPSRRPDYEHIARLERDLLE
jgi:hypothetical protein